MLSVDHSGLCIKVQSIRFNLIFLHWKCYSCDAGISVTMGLNRELSNRDPTNLRNRRAFKEHVNLHRGGNSDSERSWACLRSPARAPRTLNPIFWGSVIPVEAFSNLQSENTKVPMTLLSWAHLPKSFQGFLSCGYPGSSSNWLCLLFPNINGSLLLKSPVSKARDAVLPWVHLAVGLWDGQVCS